MEPTPYKPLGNSAGHIPRSNTNTPMERIVGINPDDTDADLGIDEGQWIYDHKHQ